MRLKFLTLVLMCSCVITSASFAQPWVTSGTAIYYNSGNVGIGTATPSKPLHVVGDALFTGTITSPGASATTEKFGNGSQVNGFYSSAFGYISYASVNSTAIGSVAIAGGSSANYNVALGAASYNYGSYSISIGATSGIEISKSSSIAIGYDAHVNHSGSIAIGTQTITTRDNQAVFGSSGAPGARIAEFVIGVGAKSPNANLGGGVTIKTTDGDGANINGADLKIKAGSGTGTGTGGFLSFATTAPGATGSTLNTAVESMRITPQANIGIGTTTPNSNAKLHVVGNIYCNNKIYIGTPDALTTNKIAQYALAVNGTAIFTKAIVRLYGTSGNGWADYVFDPSYKLTDLHALESFIIKNRHLPEVPTADEVAKEGIDLGSNQTILLKKIEELTLYIIALNKKVEQLENQNKKATVK